jgi:hypothetical protein
MARPGVVAIYSRLFTPGDPTEAKKLSALLRAYGRGGSAAPLFAFFKRLSDDRSPFGKPDFDTFADLFEPEKPLAPVPPRTAPQIDALEFWHRMVTGPVDDVVALSKILHRYKVNPGPANLKAVARWITEVKKIPCDASDTAYLRSVADQLVEISVDKGGGYQYLRWWELSQNMW